MIFIVSLIYVTDEIASQIGTLIKTEIANDLMSSFGEKSVGMLDIVSFIAIPFQALSIFYKPLSDRFGRKIFLVINTLGMSLGMLVIALSHNLALYVVGAVIIFFFVPHDMQVVYDGIVSGKASCKNLFHGKMHCKKAPYFYDAFVLLRR